MKNMMTSDGICISIQHTALRLFRQLLFDHYESCWVLRAAINCGSFWNNPKVVSRANLVVLQEFLIVFREIEFAVFRTPSLFFAIHFWEKDWILPKHSNHNHYNKVISVSPDTWPSPQRTGGSVARKYSDSL
jgi:hypothetical protein